MTESEQIVQAEIDILLRLAKRHNIVICGFAFSDEPPMLTNFGNRGDAGSLPLYERLVKICEKKQAAGEIECLSVGEVN